MNPHIGSEKNTKAKKKCCEGSDQAPFVGLSGVQFLPVGQKCRQCRAQIFGRMMVSFVDDDNQSGSSKTMHRLALSRHMNITQKEPRSSGKATKSLPSLSKTAASKKQISKRGSRNDGSRNFAESIDKTPTLPYFPSNFIPSAQKLSGREQRIFMGKPNRFPSNNRTTQALHHHYHTGAPPYVGNKQAQTTRRQDSMGMLVNNFRRNGILSSNATTNTADDGEHYEEHSDTAPVTNSNIVVSGYITLFAASVSSSNTSEINSGEPQEESSLAIQGTHLAARSGRYQRRNRSTFNNRSTQTPRNTKASSTETPIRPSMKSNTNQANIIAEAYSNDEKARGSAGKSYDSLLSTSFSSEVSRTSGNTERRRRRRESNILPSAPLAMKETVVQLSVQDLPYTDPTLPVEPTGGSSSDRGHDQLKNDVDQNSYDDTAAEQRSSISKQNSQSSGQTNATRERFFRSNTIPSWFGETMQESSSRSTSSNNDQVKSSGTVTTSSTSSYNTEGVKKTISRSSVSNQSRTKSTASDAKAFSGSKSHIADGYISAQHGTTDSNNNDIYYHHSYDETDDAHKNVGNDIDYNYVDNSKPDSKISSQDNSNRLGSSEIFENSDQIAEVHAKGTLSVRTVSLDYEADVDDHDHQILGENVGNLDAIDEVGPISSETAAKATSDPPRKSENDEEGPADDSDDAFFIPRSEKEIAKVVEVRPSKTERRKSRLRPPEHPLKQRLVGLQEMLLNNLSKPVSVDPYETSSSDTPEEDLIKAGIIHGVGFKKVYSAPKSIKTAQDYLASNFSPKARRRLVKNYQRAADLSRDLPTMREKSRKVELNPAENRPKFNDPMPELPSYPLQPMSPTPREPHPHHHRHHHHIEDPDRGIVISSYSSSSSDISSLEKSELAKRIETHRSYFFPNRFDRILHYRAFTSDEEATTSGDTTTSSSTSTSSEDSVVREENVIKAQEETSARPARMASARQRRSLGSADLEMTRETVGNKRRGSSSSTLSSSETSTSDVSDQKSRNSSSPTERSQAETYNDDDPATRVRLLPPTESEREIRSAELYYRSLRLSTIDETSSSASRTADAGSSRSDVSMRIVKKTYAQTGNMTKFHNDPSMGEEYESPRFVQTTGVQTAAVPNSAPFSLRPWTTPEMSEVAIDGKPTFRGTGFRFDKNNTEIVDLMFPEKGGNFREEALRQKNKGFSFFFDFNDDALADEGTGDYDDHDNNDNTTDNFNEQHDNVFLKNGTSSRNDSGFDAADGRVKSGSLVGSEKAAQQTIYNEFKNAIQTRTSSSSNSSKSKEGLPNIEINGKGNLSYMEKYAQNLEKFERAMNSVSGITTPVDPERLFFGRPSSASIYGARTGHAYSIDPRHFDEYHTSQYLTEFSNSWGFSSTGATSSDSDKPSEATVSPEALKIDLPKSDAGEQNQSGDEERNVFPTANLDLSIEQMIRDAAHRRWLLTQFTKLRSKVRERYHSDRQLKRIQNSNKLYQNIVMRRSASHPALSDSSRHPVQLTYKWWCDRPKPTQENPKAKILAKNQLKNVLLPPFRTSFQSNKTFPKANKLPQISNSRLNRKIKRRDESGGVSKSKNVSRLNNNSNVSKQGSSVVKKGTNKSISNNSNTTQQQANSTTTKSIGEILRDRLYNKQLTEKTFS